MIDQVQEMLNSYWVWLKDRAVLKQVDDWVEVTTPYLDRHNDYIQFYVKRHDQGLVLTDDAYIIQDLQSSGCNLNSMKRRQLLQVVLNGFGIQLKNDALTVEATSENFTLKKHNLVQAMLAVNDLFYMASSTTESLFMEDVELWLKSADIRNISRVRFTGKSGMDFQFDFVIPASHSAPERMVQAINKPDRNKAQTAVFAWIDTREVRQPESRAYALLNDTEQPPTSEVLATFRSYDIRPILWSEREAVREELAA